MTTPSGEPLPPGQELSAQQHRVLQLIYDLWSPANQWPHFKKVDRVLDKQDRIDLGQILPTIPARYLLYNRYSATDAELHLTVAGIACCTNADGDVMLFLRALRWCVRREDEFEPPSDTDDLVLNTAEARNDWTSEGAEASQLILDKAYALLITEQVPRGNGYGPAGWQVTITRDVRRFRDVNTLAEYLAVKEMPREIPMGIAVPGPPRMARVPFPPLDPESTATVQPDPRKVFVIHGRDHEARQAVFDFLRSLDLSPMPWEELVAATRQASPYNGEVVSSAFAQAQAVVVILTPDDEARLHIDLHSDHEEDHERELRGQARPNVLLEAGMALMAQPDRTVFVEIGRLRPISDITGRNTVRIGATAAPLLAFKDRLATAGCAINDSDPSWMDTQRFASLEALTRQPLPSTPPTDQLPRGQRIASRPKSAEPGLSARLIVRGEHDYLLEVVNRGGVSLRNVTWQPDPNVPNWGFRNQVLPSYPYDELPPREYVRVPVSITMGGPVVIDLALAGDTPDGSRHEQRARLSIYG